MPTQPHSGVTLIDLHYVWPDGTVALDQLSGTLTTGRTGLVGANGSGKSTLLRLIVGELVPTASRVVTSGDVAYLPQTLAYQVCTSVAEVLGVSEKLAALRAIESGTGSQRHFEVVGDDWDVDNVPRMLAHHRLRGHRSGPPDR